MRSVWIMNIQQFGGWVMVWPCQQPEISALFWKTSSWFSILVNAEWLLEEMPICLINIYVIKAAICLTIQCAYPSCTSYSDSLIRRWMWASENSSQHPVVCFNYFKMCWWTETAAPSWQRPQSGCASRNITHKSHRVHKNKAVSFSVFFIFIH